MWMRGREILSKRSAWGQAIAGAAIMAVALGASTGIGSAIGTLDGWGERLIPAVLCTVIAVVGVRLAIGWPRDRLGLGGGLGESTRAFLLGVVVTGGSAALLFALATVAGWVSWGRLDVSALLFYLAMNALVAVLLEAFPEELTLRGMTWSALRRQYGGLAAALGTTALFLFVSAGSSVVHKGVTSVLGSSSAIGWAPAGEDPFEYFFLLTIFGLTLVAARTATASKSLWTGIGTHLTFLTINRITLYGEERDAGWSADFVNADAVLIIPGYLILAALAYLAIARRH